MLAVLDKNSKTQNTTICPWFGMSGIRHESLLNFFFLLESEVEGSLEDKALSSGV